MTMPMAEEFDPDEPLIEAVRTGDRYAFEEFLRRQNRWVRGIILGVLGDRDRLDDVAQHVWTAVWQRIESLRDAKRWKPWLYRLARNAAVDAGREITRRRSLGQRLTTDLPPGKPGAALAPADSALAEKERHREVLAAIQALPALYREPFVLRHVNGWSYRDIAEVMGMPVDSVETRLVRARRLLRQSLEDKLD